MCEGWSKLRALLTGRPRRSSGLRAHDAGTFTAIEHLGKDLMYPARLARQSPGFITIAVLTLALGIGGVTAMFTVIRTVLLKPLDYPDPDRIVRIQGPFNLIRYRCTVVSGRYICCYPRLRVGAVGESSRAREKTWKDVHGLFRLHARGCWGVVHSARSSAASVILILPTSTNC